MNPTSKDSRILQPSACPIDHGGDPVVQLSPHKGLKNASILYQGIRDLPDAIQLRGGFDRKTRPCVYLHKRSPKKIGELSRSAISAATPVKSSRTRTLALTSPVSGARTRIPAAPAGGFGKKASERFIAANNKEAEKQEMAAFLASIVDTIYASEAPDPKLVRAAIELKICAHAVRESGGEFTVGALRKPLRVIARAYALERLGQTTSPHRLIPTQGEALRQKRLTAFAGIGRDTQGELNKLMRAPAMSPYDTTPEIAVYEMKAMVRAYVKQPLDRKLPFRAFLRTYAVGSHLKYFARRWQMISIRPQPLERQRLSTESWATELDRICPIILGEEKRQQRHAQIKPVTDSEGSGSGSLLYQRPTLPSLPPLPPTVNGTPPAPSAPLRQPVVDSAELQRVSMTRQPVPGQLIAASLHEIPIDAPDEPQPARIPVTARLTSNYALISPMPAVASSDGTAEQSGTSFSSFSAISSVSSSNPYIEIVKKFDETPGITYSSLALPTTGSEGLGGSRSELRSGPQQRDALDVSKTEVLSHSEASVASTAPGSPPPSGATQ